MNAVAVNNQVAAELGEVRLGADGQPVGFRYQSQIYVVVGTPTRWFTRRNWWAQAANVSRGVGAQVLEVEMLRVAAIVNQTEQQKMHYADLAREGNTWQLVRVFD